MDVFSLAVIPCPLIEILQLVKFLTNRLKFTVVDDQDSCFHLELNSGISLIEADIYEWEGKSVIVFAYSMCNPPSVDNDFVDILEKLLIAYPSSIKVNTSGLKKIDYSIHESLEILPMLTKHVTPVRDQWRKMYGDKVGPVRVEDSYIFVGWTNK